MVLEQVLSHSADRASFPCLPGKLRIQARITRNILIAKTIYKIGGRVPGNVFGPVHLRTKLDTMSRTTSFRFQRRGCVLTRRLGVHVYLLESVARADCPVMIHSPTGR